MAQFDFGKDVLINVLSRSNELAIGLANRETEAKAYIQAAYISVLAEGFPWVFARKTPPGVLVTVAEITAGSVTVTQDSITITLTNAPAASVAGYKFFIDNDPVLYRIATHTAASTSATLDTAYIAATGAGKSYHIFQDEYTLATDFLRPVNKKFLKASDAINTIELTNQAELDGFRRLLWSGSEYPQKCAFIADDKVRLWPWPTFKKRWEYAYLYHPGVLDFTGAGAGDTLIIQPAEDRVVVALMAVGNILLDKDDSRAETFLIGAQAKISSMKRLQSALTKSKMNLDSQFRVWR